jgi:hypothetical protein
VYPMASAMYHHIFRYSIQPLLEVYLGIEILQIPARLVK